MKTTSLLLSVAALCTATACSHDSESGTTDNNGRTPLCVTSGIQTRAYDNQWDDGDAIGIYMFETGTTTPIEGATNRKYITAAGGNAATFAPAAAGQTIYFPVSETPTCDLVAYYPHAAISDNQLYNVDVTTQNLQKAIDLMAAAKVTGKHKNNATVAFVFAHKLVKLEIAIQGDGTSITNDQLTNTVVKTTNQQTTATYNVVNDGNITVTETALAEITLLTTANGLKAEGIVLPTTSTDGMELTFAVPAPISQTFTWAINKAIGSQQFEAGKKYKYTITIGKSALSVTSTVTPWTAGNGDDGETGNAE